MGATDQSAVLNPSAEAAQREAEVNGLSRSR